MKKVLTAFFAFVFWSNVHATPLKIDCDQDYHILNQFFKTMFEHSEYGYVLDGEKPISTMNVFPLGDLIAPQSLNFKIAAYAREAINIWERLCPKQGDIVLKAAVVQENSSLGPTYELSLINKFKLKEVIRENIDLFRYVLGPTTDTENLVEYILNSQQSIVKTLCNNKVLIGIVLGFGTYNSLMHSRAEEIQNALPISDVPPFELNSAFMGDMGVCNFDDTQLKVVLLSQAQQTQSKSSARICFKPKGNHDELLKELDEILSKKEDIAVSLLRDNPRFVFAAYRNPENKGLIDNLKCTQENTKKLLDRSDFLECVLEKITGEKPCISSTFSVCEFEKAQNIESLVAEILWMIANQLDKETIPEFIDAFCKSNPSEIVRGRTHAMPGALENLKRARKNLQFADNWFAEFSADRNFNEIEPRVLYFEKVKFGDGKKVDGYDHLNVTYEIRDHEDNVLASSFRSWIELHEMISGFACGLQGMQEGETRIIYLHPSIAYGALTSLPSCVPLIINVTVHKIDEDSYVGSPSLKRIDLAWVKNPCFYQELEQANYQLARTLGSRWGTWLKHSSELDFRKVCDAFKGISEIDQKKSSFCIKEQLRICNHFFCDLLSKQKEKYCQ